MTALDPAVAREYEVQIDDRIAPDAERRLAQMPSGDADHERAQRRQA